MKKLMAFALLLASVFCLGGCGKEAASVGIIGGADGPTAVFVTSGWNWQNICGLLGVIAAVVLAALIIHRNKKK